MAPWVGKWRAEATSASGFEAGIVTRWILRAAKGIQLKEKRFRKRPLLVVGLGAAVITIASCGSGYTSGNLMAPVCKDGGYDDGTHCAPQDAGNKDAGTGDGGSGGDH